MTPRFDAFFGAAAIEGSGLPWLPAGLRDVPGYRDFAHRHAGATFGRGLYRFHDTHSGPQAQRLVDAAFPEYAGVAVPFGFDWVRRQYALDATRSAAAGPLLLLLQIGSGVVLDAPISFLALHDVELIDEVEATLHRSLFDAWADRHPDAVPLRPDRCAGFVVPMFRGGELEVDNLHPVDLAAYWEWCTRIDITRGLPLGITGLRDHERMPT